MSEQERSEYKAVMAGLDRVREARERIEERERDFVLRARDLGQSWDQIAKRVGVSVGTIHNRYASEDYDRRAKARTTQKAVPKKAVQK